MERNKEAKKLLKNLKPQAFTLPRSLLRTLALDQLPFAPWPFAADQPAERLFEATDQWFQAVTHEAKDPSPANGAVALADLLGSLRAKELWLPAEPQQKKKAKKKARQDRFDERKKEKIASQVKQRIWRPLLALVASSASPSSESALTPALASVLRLLSFDTCGMSCGALLAYLRQPENGFLGGGGLFCNVLDVLGDEEQGHALDAGLTSQITEVFRVVSQKLAQLDEWDHLRSHLQGRLADAILWLVEAAALPRLPMAVYPSCDQCDQVHKAMQPDKRKVDLRFEAKKAEAKSSRDSSKDEATASTHQETLAQPPTSAIPEIAEGKIAEASACTEFLAPEKTEQCRTCGQKSEAHAAKHDRSQGESDRALGEFKLKVTDALSNVAKALGTLELGDHRLLHMAFSKSMFFMLLTKDTSHYVSCVDLHHLFRLDSSSVGTTWPNFTFHKDAPDATSKACCSDVRPEHEHACLSCGSWRPGLKQCTGCRRVCQGKQSPEEKSAHSLPRETSEAVQGHEQACLSCDSSRPDLKMCQGCRCAWFCDQTCKRKVKKACRASQRAKSSETTVQPSQDQLDTATGSQGHRELDEVD
eukprot:g43267.t1